MNYLYYNDPGYSLDRVTVGQDFIAFDWSGLYFRPGSYFNVYFEQVPEPHSIILFIIGFLALIWTVKPNYALNPIPQTI